MWPFKNKKDLVVVTIRSNDMQENLIRTIKEELKKVLSDKKLAVICCGIEDTIDIQVFKE